MSITDVIDGLVLDDEKWKVLPDRKKRMLEKYYEENQRFLGNTMLLKILQSFPDCKVYMRKPRVTDEGIYRVVYTEDGIERETILYYEGGFKSGHKPKLKNRQSKFAIGAKKVLSKSKKQSKSTTKER